MNCVLFFTLNGWAGKKGVAVTVSEEYSSVSVKFWSHKRSKFYVYAMSERHCLNVKLCTYDSLYVVKCSLTVMNSTFVEVKARNLCGKTAASLLLLVVGNTAQSVVWRNCSTFLATAVFLLCVLFQLFLFELLHFLLCNNITSVILIGATVILFFTNSGKKITFKSSYSQTICL